MCESQNPQIQNCFPMELITEIRKALDEELAC